MAANNIIGEVDSRKRISLGKVKNRAERYLIEEERDGTVILRPVEVVTAEDKLLLAHPEIAEAIRKADERASSSQPYVRRTPRRSGGSEARRGTMGSARDLH